jgi:1,4-dihydroxy-2-naphthoate octaprenyltransferase
MMRSKIKNLVPITRVEFIPANSASVLIGFAWAIDRGYVFNQKSIGLLFALFVVLSAVGTLGAHWNSYSDQELDADDPTKAKLHKSLTEFGKKTLKNVIWIEFILATAIFLVFWFYHQSWFLLGIWLTAIFLAFAYSMPPIRFKAKGILAFITLCLVLSILPILFIHLTINQSVSGDLLTFLIGHTLVIYSLIIPTEIRDYEVDKNHQISTMTVWLGLKNTIVFAQMLMAVGTILIVIGYLVSGYVWQAPILLASMLIILGCNGYVFVNLNQLRKLIYISQKDEDNPIKKVWELAENNPKWITISSVGSMLAAFAMVVVKIALN